ncbi:hypothetical protein [Silvibacterium sp.]|uniref:hypothetical protein n=1 Tax=Silvibacterium sp. TaxID=1964179 RepID=UPI0039E64B54
MFDLKHATSHLWVITTNPNPDGYVLVVSLTSLKGSKDQTVILNPADHPFIKWATCVAYAFSDLMTVEKLSELIECGNAKQHHPMSADRTQLILDGFLSSDFTKKRIVQFVKQYKATHKQ